MTDTRRPGITARQWADAALVWDYHRMGHERRPCDVAIGLGCHDLGVAAETAALYLDGLVPRIVFTGGPNPARPERFPRGEAAHFTEHALALGVPAHAIGSVHEIRQRLFMTSDSRAWSGDSNSAVLQPVWSPNRMRPANQAEYPG